MTRRTIVLFALAAAMLLVAPTPGAAYGGPGSILTGLGALSAVVFALVASVFGFLWFPLKRLASKLRSSTSGPESETPLR